MRSSQPGLNSGRGGFQQQGRGGGRGGPSSRSRRGTSGADQSSSRGAAGQDFITQCVICFQPPIQLRTNLPFPIAYEIHSGADALDGGSSSRAGGSTASGSRRSGRNAGGSGWSFFGGGSSSSRRARRPPSGAPSSNEVCSGQLRLNERQDVHQVSLDKGTLTMTLCMYATEWMQTPVEIYRPAFIAPQGETWNRGRDSGLSYYREGIQEPQFQRRTIAEQGGGRAGGSYTSGGTSRSVAATNSEHVPVFCNAVQKPGATNYSLATAGFKQGGQKAGKNKMTGSKGTGGGAGGGNSATAAAAGDDLEYDRLKFALSDPFGQQTNLWVEFQNRSDGVLDIILYTDLVLCNYLPLNVAKSLRFLYFDRRGVDVQSSDYGWGDWFDDTLLEHHQ
eukprot:GSA25T00027258001.1